ncbi:ABC transporter permease [Egicoccus sp. AB-alg2]|uniref:ABC transporter permease n=1 Tax=Egicoccus sp. AB-alg2 TaxID=3242693 RepID=UPI00359EBB5F
MSTTRAVDRPATTTSPERGRRGGAGRWSALVGTPRLFRLALRRDRILLPVWIGVLVALLAGIASTITALYASQQDRIAAAMFGAATPATRVFDGPASGTSLGAMTMVESFGILAILIGLMSGQAVVRHTRHDEETGRAELLGSAVVGHHARLTAALSVVLLANLVLAAGMTGVLLAYDLPVRGSVASGLAFAGVGMTFAAIAAVAAQVASTQRAANGIVGAAIGAAFLLRAIGDLFGEVAASEVELVSAWPSWLSPIGWGQQVRPFHQDNLEVFALFAGLTVVLVAVAFVLTEHRDVGHGMLPVPTGPARADGLDSPMALAWRLHRGSLLAWAVGIAVVAVAFGSVGDAADDILTENEQLQEALASLTSDGGLRDAFFAFMMAFVGVGAAGFTVQTLLRARNEEIAGRLEPLLATPVSRSRWLGGHVVFAAAGTVAIFVLAGLSAAVTYGFVTGDFAVGVRGLGSAALVQLPAALALGGGVVLAFALAPRWAVTIGWGALTLSLVLGQLGAVLDLPQWVLNVSPFTHVPLVPAAPMAWLPVGVLLAVAAALSAAGFALFRRRDLAIGA